MIVVVGDYIQDILYDCIQDRMCPEEATAPVLRVFKKICYGGGAFNVACNVKSLGGRFLYIGDQNLKKVTVKSRFMVDDKIVFRVDEDTSSISFWQESQFVRLIESFSETVSVFIISDYVKGVVTDRVVESVFRQAAKNNAFVIVDSKNLARKCFQQGDPNRTIFKPNFKEATELVRVSEMDSMVYTATSLVYKLNNHKILLTCGARGMVLADMLGVTYIPGHCWADVVDVTGAGDTVAAAFAVALERGASYEVAARFANAAAAIAVTKKGTYAPTLEEVSTLYVHPDITNSGDRSKKEKTRS